MPPCSSAFRPKSASSKRIHGAAPRFHIRLCFLPYSTIPRPHTLHCDISPPLVSHLDICLSRFFSKPEHSNPQLFFCPFPLYSFLLPFAPVTLPPKAPTESVDFMPCLCPPFKIAASFLNPPSIQTFRMPHLCLPLPPAVIFCPPGTAALPHSARARLTSHFDSDILFLSLNLNRIPISFQFNLYEISIISHSIKKQSWLHWLPSFSIKGRLC